MVPSIKFHTVWPAVFVYAVTPLVTGQELVCWLVGRMDEAGGQGCKTVNQWKKV